MTEMLMEAPALPGLPPVPMPDLSALDLSTLSAWHLRLALASKGWRTSMEMTTGLGYQGWHFRLSASHSNWHGSLSGVDIAVWMPWDEGVTPWDDIEDTVERVRGQFVRLHDRCQETWDACRDFVPHGYRNLQGDGGWHVEPISNRYYQRFPQGVVQPERSQVTHRLPGWTGQPSMADFISVDDCLDEWVRTIVGHLRTSTEAGAVIQWKDDFNPFASPRGSYKNQDWQLVHRGVIFRVDGARVLSLDAPRMLQGTTQNISALGARSLAVMVADQTEGLIKLAKSGKASVFLGAVPPPTLVADAVDETEDI
ncbi:hypothetical protein ACTVH1_16875 [Gluconobacter cerinus]